LQRFIRETRPEVNLFKDPAFAGFQRTLDGDLKRLRSLGLGVKKKQAKPISFEEENLLWERGLGNPQALLDTVLFLYGIHFALRSGDEHRSLQLAQFELGCARLIYTENYSKNSEGGIQHRKVKLSVSLASQTSKTKNAVWFVYTKSILVTVRQIFSHST
jgi:hypothetical protein